MKRRLNSILALVAMLAAPCPVVGETPLGTVEKVEVPGIVNFSRIEHSQGFAGSLVGFGGATEPAAMPYLRESGLATVISLRRPDEEGVDVEASRLAAEAAGLRYIHLPLDSENPVPGDIERVLDAAGDKANQPVYIHCKSATRAGAVWMTGRVLKDGWDIDAAQRETGQIAKDPNEAISFATGYIASKHHQDKETGASP